MAGLATLFTLMTVVGAVVSIFGAAEFGWQVGDTRQVNLRMGQVHVEMKNIYDQLHQNGRITLAEAQLAKHNVDRNAELLDRMAQRVVARQGEIVTRSGALFVADIVGILVGGISPGRGAATLTVQQAALRTDFYTLLYKTLGFSVSTASSGLSRMGASQVEFADIKDIVDELRVKWGEPADAFEQAMVAAKFRIFLRGVEGLPPEQKREAYSEFWQRLKKEGWKLAGMKSREERLDFTRKVKRDYEAGKKAKPSLAISRFSVQPERVAPGDELGLEAEVEITGARGQLTVAFEREGERLFSAPAEPIDLEPGATRRYSHAYTFAVEQDTVPGNYSVAVKAELELARESGRETVDVLRAAETGAFTVRPFTSCQRFRRKWEERNHNVLERLQPPCESRRKSEIARLEARGMSRSDAENTAPPCGMASPTSLYPGDLSIAHAFEDSRCNVHESYVECMDPAANDYHRELMQCYRQYVATYSADNAVQLTKTLGDCTRAAEAGFSGKQDRCESNACDAKCAAFGKAGRVGGLFSGTCECVPR